MIHLSKNVCIVIPVFNEEQNIPVLIDRIFALDIPYAVRILFVDDGSTDGSLRALKKAAAREPRISFISFSRNFGHQAALKAGFDHADEDCIITMDGDMQHPPDLVGEMLDRWAAGADVVHTVRRQVKGQGFTKKCTSSLFYKLMGMCANVPIQAGTADFRLLDARVVEVCRNLNEGSFFWRGLIPWVGFRQEFIDYTPGQREYGASKYTLRKMARLAWDGISSFSLLPLRIATILGTITLCGCFSYGLYVLYCAIAGKTISGWASLMTTILGLNAIQMIFLGIMGEYIGKIFLNGKRRPTYLIKERSNPPVKIKQGDTHE